MKREVSKRSKIIGVVFGLMLTFVMAVVAVTQVITNGDFWLKQNDRYNHEERLSLVSSDDYSTIYHNYISMFKGEINDFTVTIKGDPNNFTDTFKKLNTVNSGVTDSQYEESFSLDEKYFDTVEKIENLKYSNVSLDNKMYIQFLCPSATTDFAGINIKNLTVTDGDGKKFDVSFKKEMIGSESSETVEKSDVVFFNPNSRSMVLRAYLSGGNFENVNVKFDVSSVEGNADVEVLFSYEEELSAEGVAAVIGTEENIITDAETEQIVAVGAVNNFLIICAIFVFIFAIIMIVFSIFRYGRESLYGIGLYNLVIVIAFLISINFLASVVPSRWGFDCMFNFEENSLSSIIMGENFMNDFVKGTLRFFDFIMILPLFLGYLFIKKSEKKQKDPNEDYLYQ